MKTRKLVLSIVLLIAIQICDLMGQNGYLNAGNVSAKINAKGLSFGDLGFEYPKQSSKYAFGESALWFTAINSQDDTLVSASMISNSSSDFQSGPLSLDGTQGDIEEPWDSAFFVDKTEVERHLNGFNSEGYMMDQTIQNWPGNGPSGFTQLLAPFIDWNSNGNYEPDSGDSPYLFGEQMAYTVFNDRTAHDLSNSQSMGIEVQSMNYAFKKTGFDEFDNLIISQVIVTNGSTENYTKFRYSLAVDYILGDDGDNFVGTDANNHFVYCYNGGAGDSEYGQNPPCLVVFPFDRIDSLSSTIYLTSDNDLQSGFPVNKSEFVNYSYGKWRNGTSLTFGSDGLDGTTPCKYVYPGSTDPDFSSQNWTEETSGNDPGKRSFLLNLISNDLGIGSTLKKSIGYFVLDSYSGDVNDIAQSVNTLRNLYEQGRFTSVIVDEVKPLVVTPNPVQQGGTLKLEGNIKNIQSVELYNMIGKRIWDIGKIDNNNFILSENVPKGMYFLKAKTKTAIYLGKFYVQ
jgi:hypothetical protein